MKPDSETPGIFFCKRSKNKNISWSNMYCDLFPALPGQSSSLRRPWGCASLIGVLHLIHTCSASAKSYRPGINVVSLQLCTYTTGSGICTSEIDNCTCRLQWYQLHAPHFFTSGTAAYRQADWNTSSCKMTKCIMLRSYQVYLATAYVDLSSPQLLEK